MNFSSNSSITLSDSISGYVTADEDDGNDETHYLSVLSEDISFEAMNITLSNSQILDNDETQLVEVAEDIDQPLVFTIDGSNEIYGVQVARDEDGNLHKYQMQYTENMNGELVPILETIQMLPSDDEVQTETLETGCATPSDEISPESEEIEQTFSNNQLIYEEEAVDEDHNENNCSDQEDGEFSQNEDSTDNIDCKPGLESTDFTAHQRVFIKQECVDVNDERSRHSNENSENSSINEMDTEINFDIPHMSFKSEDITDALVQVQVDENHVMSTEELRIEECIDNEEQNQIVEEENVDQQHFEQLFIEEKHISEHNQNGEHEHGNEINENDSDNEMYHIVDGIHITGDAENEAFFKQPVQTVLKESAEHHTKTNILKKPTQQSVLKDQTCLDQKVIYVHTLPEKENMQLVEIGRIPIPNSRSLLKCNQPCQKVSMVPDPLHVEAIAEESNISKRYSRTKEAKQARQFRNFINSTTIPQVPERKERLPRKQQIKPVKHINEDIVVKEMIVSSNNFIEPISAEEKKYLPVMEYVELIDSGDEGSSSNANEKKNKFNKNEGPIEIDSEESDVSIIELDLEENKTDELKNASKVKNVKKKRGRPPKNKNNDNDKKDSDSNSESPPKISRTEESDLESVTSGLEIIQVRNETNDAIPSGNSDNIVVSTELKVSTVDGTVLPKIWKDTSGINELEYHVEDSPSDFDHASETRTNSEEQISESSEEVPKTDTTQCSEAQSKKGFDLKYECEKCKSKFINKFVLNRHDCIVKSALPFSCDACPRRFPNVTSLSVHKRVHAKGQLALGSSKIPQTRNAAKSLGTSDKATARIPRASTVGTSSAPTAGVTRAPTAGASRAPTTGVSRAPTTGVSRAPTTGVSRAPTVGVSRAPTAGVSRAPTAGVSRAPTVGDFRAPATRMSRAPATGVSRAPDVGLSRASTVGVSRATTSEVSRAPLKISAPTNNKVKTHGIATKNPPKPAVAESKSVTKNFLKPSSQVSVVVTPEKNSSTNHFKIEKQCDKCSMKFSNNAAWFDHQVLKHGLATPDKSIGEKKPKKLVKGLIAHNGIHAAPSVARNFSVLRSKMQQLQ